MYKIALFVLLSFSLHASAGQMNKTTVTWIQNNSGRVLDIATSQSEPEENAVRLQHYLLAKPYYGIAVNYKDLAPDSCAPYHIDQSEKSFIIGVARRDGRFIHFIVPAKQVITVDPPEVGDPQFSFSESSSYEAMEF